ncbi:NAD(P)-binding protein [Lentinula raphanica]|uniref:NAD(P)-binding protein n=1 Tax=Lentinula raphanica TaxID=153919 RepID=A0AA38P7Z0_9AGAR|nr:NAD(P)-binding protein [Lentinula raphanica]KAJ3974629.1 NAD(P)-binding protein [Lentinula raphanica]
MSSQSTQAHNAKFKAQNLFDVSGWACVVTGGGTGIGLMIAQAFANNGARVYITSRRKSVLDNAVETWGNTLAHPKGQLIALECDITDKSSIQKLVEQVKQKEKNVDVLVNNAGVSLGSSEVEKGDESAEQLSEELFGEDLVKWEDVYRTNVIGHFFTTAAFIPLLAATATVHPGRTAAVINNTSMSGITRTTQHHFKYNVSKGAAIHLTTLLAQELRREKANVRVNSVAPGIFPSEMTADESDESNKSTIPTGDDYGEKKGIPAGRPGRDEDMAQAVLMLACNQYAYGQTIAIEGGYLLHHP